MERTKCECPEIGKVQWYKRWMYRGKEKAGMNHMPGKCQGTYQLQLYRRKDKIFLLCSCCHRPGDVPL